MSVPRIEFTECYQDEVLEEDREYFKNLKISLPERDWKYRRVYPRLPHIDYPREITGDKEHCEIVFHDGSVMKILGSYDVMTIFIEDRERQYEEELTAEWEVGNDD